MTTVKPREKLFCDKSEKLRWSRSSDHTAHRKYSAEEAGDAGDDEWQTTGNAASERSAVDNEDGDDVDGDLYRAADERAQVDVHWASQVCGKQRQRKVDESTRKPERMHITSDAHTTPVHHRKTSGQCNLAKAASNFALL